MASLESQITHLQAEGEEAMQPLYAELPDWAYEVAVERQKYTLSTPPRKPKREVGDSAALPLKRGIEKAEAFTSNKGIRRESRNW